MVGDNQKTFLLNEEHLISRYNIKEIEQIWSDEYRFKTFLDVELALIEALEEFSVIPSGTKTKFDSVKINPTRILEIEQVTRHDIIAFCSSVTEQVDASAARFFHYGVTSSDIIDTALSLQIKKSLKLIISELQELLNSLRNKIHETKEILCIGRSHGMSAEPMIFAAKFASFFTEFSRRLQDYENAIDKELNGQISGAVGNYTILTLEIEKATLSKLGLKREPLSTQVIPRDHIAKIIGIGSLLASGLERMATEVRLLHHSDISEVSEGFKKGQKGSSTMPHKKNPISSENISGLSRIIKSHFNIALENCVLWHERDISHSSSERMMLPDHFGIIAYLLKRSRNMIENLEIHEKNMTQKVEKQFSYLSSYLLHKLILINKCPRESIYEIVQKASFQATNRDNFLNLIRSYCDEAKLVFPSEVSFDFIEEKYKNEFSKIIKEISIN